MFSTQNEWFERFFNNNFLQFLQKTNAKTSLEDAKKTGLIGSELGLSFVLNSTTADYYFSIGDHVGFYVQILYNSEFPDSANGGLTQMLIDTNTESFFKLMPITFISKPSVGQYSAVQRGCLLGHELFHQFGGQYNFVDCLVKCKLQRIVALCDCMPFFMPTNFPDQTGSRVKCTLGHNRCLARWKSIQSENLTPSC